MNLSLLGRLAFIAGLIIAVLAAFGFDAGIAALALAILGLIVGFLNVTGQESRTFLLAAIGLMLSATSVQGLPIVGEVVTDILTNLVAFLAAAVLVVSIRSLFLTVSD